MTLAYVVLMVSAFQIIGSTILGTIIETEASVIQYSASQTLLFICYCIQQSTKVCTSFQELCWYNLPKSEIQNYRILLLCVAKPQILYLAGVKPLNMELCLAVSSYILYNNISTVFSSALAILISCHLILDL